MRLPRRRIGAWLIDWACILGWAGVMAGIGVPLYRAGLMKRRNLVQLNLIAALVMVVPVVLATAILESGGAAATPGKRALGLTVRTFGSKPTFGTALLRNTLKIGVPWLIGHAAAIGLASGDSRSGRVPTGLWVLTGAAYALPVFYIASLFVGDGRTPYDRIAGTQVVGRLVHQPPASSAKTGRLVHQRARRAST